MRWQFFYFIFCFAIFSIFLSFFNMSWWHFKMGSLNDPRTYQRGLQIVGQINGRKLGLFRIPTTILYCCQYMVYMYVYVFALLLYIFMSKISCHLSEVKCNFAILCQTFQQMSKIVKCTSRGTQIGQSIWFMRQRRL